MRNIKTYVPGVSVEIVDNSTALDLSTGLVYAGIFKSNRGPHSKIYTTKTQFSSLCGYENPATSVGLGSINDLLSSSTNVLAVRIIRPYSEQTKMGDSYAYLIYNNKEGWVTPDGVAPHLHMVSPDTYTFQPDEAFIVTSLAEGSFYNSISVSLTYIADTESYTLKVYDSEGSTLEIFTNIIFQINDDGTDMEFFVENVVSSSQYIQVKCNYQLLKEINGNLSPTYFSTVNNISLSQFANSYTETSQFVNFGITTDTAGNIYIVGGQTHLSTSTADISTEVGLFNTQIFQYNVLSGLWIALSNTNNPLFNNVNYRNSLISATSFFVNDLEGAIYFMCTDSIEDDEVQVFKYSLSTYSWSKLSNLTFPVSTPAHSFTAISSCISLNSGNILITLVDDNDSKSYLMEYNPTSNVIVELSDLTALVPAITGQGIGNKYRAPEIFLYDGKIFLYNQANTSLYFISLDPVTHIPTVTLVGNISGLTSSTAKYTDMWISNNILYILSVNSTYKSVLVAYSFITGSSTVLASNISYLNRIKYLTNITTASYSLFNKPALLPFSSVGVPLVIGTTNSTGTDTSGVTLSSVFLTASSLSSISSLALGTDLPISELNSVDVKRTLDFLYNKKEYPQLDILADCGFNSMTNIMDMNQLVTTRQDGIHIISIPAPYERSEKSSAQFRKAININNGNSFLVTPGQYVRPDNYTGLYSYFAMSGAVTSNCGVNDNINGPWQAAVGPTNGNLSLIYKLPPKNPLTPLVLNYDEINYSDPETLASNQVNIVGKYNPQNPGIYLQTDYMLTTKNSLLQSMSIKRTVIYIASQAAMRAVKLLYSPNNEDTWARAYVMFDSWLKLIASAPGALTSYKVVCNSTNNPPELVDNNILNITLSLLPPSLVKFVNLTIVVNNLESSVNITFDQ